MLTLLGEFASEPLPASELHAADDPDSTNLVLEWDAILADDVPRALDASWNHLLMSVSEFRAVPTLNIAIIPRFDLMAER
jgi:hypothetical protein